MQRWEYMTWRLTNDLGEPDARIRFIDGRQLDSKERPSLYEALPRAGDDGWELVAMADRQGMVFKRLKPEA